MNMDELGLLTDPIANGRAKNRQQLALFIIYLQVFQK